MGLILSESAKLAEEVPPNGGVGLINCRRRDGATALWMAAQMGYESVIRVLLRAGADPNITRNVVRHSIHDFRLATVRTSLFSIQDGMSPLMKACQKGHEDVVRELLQWSPALGNCQVFLNNRPISINCKNLSTRLKSGESPLHTAVLSQNASIVRMLLKAGANPDLLSTRSSASPYALAKQQKLWHIVRLFDVSKMPRLPNA